MRNGRPHVKQKVTFEPVINSYQLANMSVSGRFLASFSKTILRTVKTDSFNYTKSPGIRSISTTLRKYSEKRYSDKHEWVQISGKIATIGISNYAQEALGDVVYAQLPDIGSEFSQHDECGALESVKAASEIYTPVSGKVVEKNAAVEETPGLVNQSCYDQGWLFKLEISKEDEFQKLMTEDQYKEFLKTDQH